MGLIVAASIIRSKSLLSQIGLFPSGKEQSGLPLGNNVFAVGVAERAEGFKTSGRIDGVSEAWDWERRARHAEAGELKLGVPSEASKGGLGKKGKRGTHRNRRLIRRTNSATPPG